MKYLSWRWNWVRVEAACPENRTKFLVKEKSLSWAKRLGNIQYLSWKLDFVFGWKGVQWWDEIFHLMMGSPCQVQKGLLVLLARNIYCVWQHKVGYTCDKGKELILSNETCHKVAAEIHFCQLATDFYEWMGEILSGECDNQGLLLEQDCVLSQREREQTIPGIGIGSWKLDRLGLIF